MRQSSRAAAAPRADARRNASYACKMARWSERSTPANLMREAISMHSRMHSGCTQDALSMHSACTQHALKDALSVPSARTQHALNMHSACTLHALMMYLLRAARASSRWSNGSTKGERRERPAAMMRMGCRQPSMLRGSERRQLGDHQEAISRQLGEYQLDLDLNLTCQREASCRCERRPGASRGGVRGASAPAEDPREPDEGSNQLMREAISLLRGQSV